MGGNEFYVDDSDVIGAQRIVCDIDDYSPVEVHLDTPEEVDLANRLVLDLRDHPIDVKGSPKATIGRVSEIHDDRKVDEMPNNEQLAEEIEELVKLDSKPQVVYPDTWRVNLHLFLDHPESSMAANIWAMFMGAMIVTSIMMLVARPLSDRWAKDEGAPVWFGLEVFFTVCFAVEYLLRLFASNALRLVGLGTQTRCEFARMPSNVCDLVAITPLFIDMILGSEDSEIGLFRGARLIKLTRFVRFLRLARLLRLQRLVSRSALAGPVAVVLTVIWFIYLKEVE